MVAHLPGVCILLFLQLFNFLCVCGACPYSPVSQNPQFMLIGINPGGDESCFDETRDSKIPLEHEYFKEDYRLAEIMRDILKQAGLKQELKQSVKTNLNFFRSKSEKQWNEIEANLKK